MLYRPQFFHLYELVCPEVYNKFGDTAWMFLEDKTVINLDWIRRTLNKPITVNTWYDDGEFDERGLRCIQCKIVKDNFYQGKVYVSPHILGKAYDFDVQGMTADEVRVWLAVKKDFIPYPIRLEQDVNWCHMDTEETGLKIQLFNN
jgi:hypothetical protein